MVAEPDTNVPIRRGAIEDLAPCHELMWEAATDLGKRHGSPLQGTASEWWQSLEPFQRFLAREAAEWWVAEGSDGRLIGYARSIERGSYLELTELFVRPGEQSRGLGRELMERAFPTGRGQVRLIIATTDVRAIARYHAAGTEARFPIFTLTGRPTAADAGALTAVVVDGGSEQLAEIGDIEGQAVGEVRTGSEIDWLVENRHGYLYRRSGRTVGFAFIGLDGAGPIATTEPTEMPAVLLHVVSRAAEMGIESLDLEVPAPNTVAIDHLSRRGFRLHPWINLLMSNKPFGRLDRYIGFSPPIVL